MKSRLTTIKEFFKGIKTSNNRKAFDPIKEAQGKLTLLQLQLENLEREYSIPLIRDGQLTSPQVQKYELSRKIDKLNNIMARESSRKNLRNHILFSWFFNWFIL